MSVGTFIAFRTSAFVLEEVAQLSFVIVGLAVRFLGRIFVVVVVIITRLASQRHGGIAQIPAGSGLL